MAHRGFDSHDAYAEAIDAIMENDVEKLRRLTETRLEDHDEARFTILYATIQYASLEMTKLLLDAGFHRDYYTTTLDNQQIFSPLHEAFKIEDRKTCWEMITLLVESGVSPKNEYLYSESCMYKAVALGDFEMVRYLIHNGADVKFSDNECAKGIHRTTCHPLLHTAISKLDGDVCLEMVKLLIEFGADVNVKGSGETLLHLTASQKSNSCEILKLLLGAGANLNCLDHYGASPLAQAAYHGDTELMKQMIAAGAEVNLSKKCIKSPLYNAVRNHHKEAVQLLLESGADLHVMDENDSILRMAAYFGNANKSKLPDYIDILKILFAHGANPRCTNVRNYIPFQRVLESGTVEAMKIFLENGITLDNCGIPHPLHAAAKNAATKDVLEYLLKSYRYDVDEIEHSDDESCTALFNAVAHENDHNVRLLIEWGADVNLPLINIIGEDGSKSVESPLYYAADNADSVNVDLLLTAGANMDADTGFDTEPCITNRDFLSEEGLDVFGSITAEIALLKSQGHSVENNKSVLMKKFSDMSPELEILYFDELEKLKNLTFCQSCTLYDLLRGEDVTRYINNIHINDFDPQLMYGRSAYGYRIGESYSLAKVKREVRDQAIEKLGKLTKFHLRFNYEILSMITYHLSLKDLRNLCGV
ncbi:hypothetical protein QAD02_018765 [Eretmocerus hayati]|uniref:Uncharacterized protein n=1 Tax=Eretmocerus hayati TaxID=131215 RepID=A0ACC2PHN1_9HYME|nr:hypothetical protein QAD02_018765 [Eretmocerus hayati]